MKKLLSILGEMTMIISSGVLAVACTKVVGSSKNHKDNKDMKRELTDEENFKFIKKKEPMVEEFIIKLSDSSSDNIPTFTESENDLILILGDIYNIYGEAKEINTFEKAVEILSKKAGSSKDKIESRRELSNYLKKVSQKIY
ncbi:lipoprotein [Mycoplasma putrefaciens]|uniref:Lipoprotein n=2 Tax=Mycoplasma putrefaciens TaxID=2123 RepID=A0A7U3ZS03_MYCPK|nr:lipoprotein [Mycoplasma putrefaciens]AEM68424.1 lipoprotein [Mycoplasma putrefaciens KS1]SYV94743.1 lipoprotein [Mycoplasma putrefaciens]